jgi:hypothetical protein
MRANAVDLPVIEHPSVWDANTMRRDMQWLVPLDQSARSEICRAVDAVQNAELSLLTMRRSDFVLPTLARHLIEWRREVLHGRGFVQLRSLPAEALGRDGMAIAFWGLGLHMGDQFASQNKHGHLLGHVKDLGESRNNVSQRGPYSRERIPFHVDACDIVGLACVNTARRGGESSVASSALIYNRLLAEAPALARALTQPVFRDRRDEIPPSKPPWYSLPVFNVHDGLLSASIEPTYIGSVARHFGGTNPHTPAQLEAIERVQELADEVRLDIAFESGDVQFVNNHALMHSRRAFEDYDEPAKRRHLYRMWMLNHDGRPLPDAFYERQGTRETLRRPGGIFDAHTRVNAPMA